MGVPDSAPPGEGMRTPNQEPKADRKHMEQNGQLYQMKADHANSKPNTRFWRQKKGVAVRLCQQKQHLRVLTVAVEYPSERAVNRTVASFSHFWKQKHDSRQYRY